MAPRAAALAGAWYSALKARQLMWNGDYLFLIRKLVLKDFKVRYRNMSLGVLWSLVNPVIMMAVLTFVFTKIYRTTQGHYPIFVLCGLLPFNFFSVAWNFGTGSVLDNAALIKRVPVPREAIPIATVLSFATHLAIQIALLLAIVIVFGPGPNVHWLWLPVVLSLEVIFVVGLVLMTAGLHVFIRDTRYVVESINTVMFWLVPIFYSLAAVPRRFWEIYQYNPLAALTVSLRDILLLDQSPANTLLTKMTLVSFTALAGGWFIFRKLKAHFYNYL
jgi:lipopolysaccharide transport system permease protein